MEQDGERFDKGETKIEEIIGEKGNTNLILGKVGDKRGPSLSIYPEYDSDNNPYFMIKGNISGARGGYMELPIGTFVIGRMGDIIVNDPNNVCSREHLMVTNDGTSYSLRNLGQNGLYEVE